MSSSSFSSSSTCISISALSRRQTKKEASKSQVEHIVLKTEEVENMIYIHHQLLYASADMCRRCHLLASSSDLHNDYNHHHHQNYVHLQYHPLSNNVIMDFNVFMNNRTPCKYVFHIVQSFAYLLDTFLLFNDTCELCFVNFSIQHVGFYNIDNPHCFLHSIDHCFNPDYLHSIDYLQTFFRGVTDKENQPLEIRVIMLLFLTLSDEEVLSTDWIIDETMKMKMKMKTQRNCYHEWKSLLIPYLQWPRNKIILHLVQQWHSTWNGYRLSRLYLPFVANIIHSFNINLPFMMEFQQLLKNNVSKRNYTLQETKDIYHQLFIKHPQWCKGV